LRFFHHKHSFAKFYNYIYSQTVVNNGILCDNYPHTILLPVKNVKSSLEKPEIVAQKKSETNHGNLAPSRHVENSDGFVEVDEAKISIMRTNSDITNLHTEVISVGPLADFGML